MSGITRLRDDADADGAATSRIRVGTLVSSLYFRQPVTLATGDVIPALRSG